jgi:hypothetical protein
MEIDKVGIDLGKSVFHLAGLSVTGETVVRKKFSRLQLLRFTANLRVRVIGMEACGGAHFLGRALRDQGHDVRLMPAQYVKPYVKTNKNDYIDAEAIAEAVERPRMRYVLIKSEEQLDMQALRPGTLGKEPHCTREPDPRSSVGTGHHDTEGPPACRSGTPHADRGCREQPVRPSAPVTDTTDVGTSAVGVSDHGNRCNDLTWGRRARSL